jgi:NAD(P)H-hydrate epimerase
VLKKFPNRKWVIDAGSLQVMDADWIPPKAVLTPNKKELKILFGKNKNLQSLALKYNCTIVAKGPETTVFSPGQYIKIQGGNPGLTKGGTGDCLAGLTLALLAKNNPLLASCAASYVLKNAADELYKKVKTFYNADDLADHIPKALHRLTTSKLS